MNLLDWSRLPSLTALRAFEAAARAQSFSAAARSLNVTHAAVAQQVKALEDHLGLQLVQRSTRGIDLTPDGRVLAEELRNGFGTIAAAVDRLQDRDRDRPVRVTTTAYFAEAVIFPRIASFWSANPGVEVSFASSDDPVDIVAEGFDLAIRAGEGNWPGLHATVLVESPTRVCAAPHLVDDPSTEWSRIPYLIPDNSNWERAALSASGIDPDHIMTRDMGNPALEIRAGEEGIGLVVESEIDLRAQLDKGTLKIAPVPVAHISRYFIVTPPWAPRQNARRFIDWLKRLGPTI